MVDKCFGSNGRNGCNILTVHKCQQDKCSFYKSTQDLEEDRKKVYLLLAVLPPDMQRYISDKYYNGRMPWAWDEPVRAFFISVKEVARCQESQKGLAPFLAVLS
jgi:hypothetical protein